MKVLLAVDGSEPARASVDFVAAFPWPSATEITVLTIIREILPSDQVAELSVDRRREFEQARLAAEQEAGSLVDSEVERLRQAGLSASGEVVIGGHPAEEIVQAASARHSDIIAMGAHGLSDTKRFLLGSVSDRVFEYAPCSVLITKPPADAKATADFPCSNEQWRILLAFDDSPPAREAVRLCASLPLAPDTKVKALTVMPMIRMYHQDVRQQLSWVWQEKKQRARMALDWLNAEIDWKGIQVSTELIESGDVAQAVLENADAFCTDLIVVGNKSRSAFQRFLLGSITARIAHHAHCSVLSVRERG